MMGGRRWEYWLETEYLHEDQMTERWHFARPKGTGTEHCAGPEAISLDFTRHDEPSGEAFAALVEHGFPSRSAFGLFGPLKNTLLEKLFHTGTLTKADEDAYVRGELQFERTRTLNMETDHVR